MRPNGRISLAPEGVGLGVFAIIESNNFIIPEVQKPPLDLAGGEALREINRRRENFLDRLGRGIQNLENRFLRRGVGLGVSFRLGLILLPLRIDFRESGFNVHRGEQSLNGFDSGGGGSDGVQVAHNVLLHSD